MAPDNMNYEIIIPDSEIQKDWATELLNQLLEYEMCNKPSIKAKLEETWNFYCQNIEELKTYIRKNLDYENISESSHQLKVKILDYFIEEWYITQKWETLKWLDKILSTFWIIGIKSSDHDLEFDSNEKILFTPNSNWEINIEYIWKIIWTIAHIKKEQ